MTEVLASQESPHTGPNFSKRYKVANVYRGIVWDDGGFAGYYGFPLSLLVFFDTRETDVPDQKGLRYVGDVSLIFGGKILLVEERSRKATGAGEQS